MAYQTTFRRGEGHRLFMFAANNRRATWRELQILTKNFSSELFRGLQPCACLGSYLKSLGDLVPRAQEGEKWASFAVHDLKSNNSIKLAFRRATMRANEGKFEWRRRKGNKKIVVALINANGSSTKRFPIVKIFEASFRGWKAQRKWNSEIPSSISTTEEENGEKFQLNSIENLLFFPFTSHTRNLNWMLTQFSFFLRSWKSFLPPCASFLAQANFLPRQFEWIIESLSRPETVLVGQEEEGRARRISREKHSSCLVVVKLRSARELKRQSTHKHPRNCLHRKGKNISLSLWSILISLDW